MVNSIRSKLFLGIKVYSFVNGVDVSCKFSVSFSIVFLLRHICVLFRSCSFRSVLVILFSFLFPFELFQCRALERGKRPGLEMSRSEISDERPVKCERYRETGKTANSAGRKRLYCCTSCCRSFSTPQKLTSPNAAQKHSDFPDAGRDGRRSPAFDIVFVYSRRTRL